MEHLLLICMPFLSCTRDIERIFKPVFIQKVYALFLELTCSFVVLMNVRIHFYYTYVKTSLPTMWQTHVEENFVRLFIAVAFIGMSSFQFGVLCIVGQRVTSVSEDLMNATYDSALTDKDIRFKKMLLIVREFSRQPIPFGVLSIKFSHENFKHVMDSIYNSYNNLSSAVKPQIKNKS